jgi:hypothetical protein
MGTARPKGNRAPHGTCPETTLHDSNAPPTAFGLVPLPQGAYTFKALLTLSFVLMTRSLALGEQLLAVQQVTQAFEVNLAAGLVSINFPIRHKVG